MFPFFVAGLVHTHVRVCLPGTFSYPEWEKSTGTQHLQSCSHTKTHSHTHSSLNSICPINLPKLFLIPSIHPLILPFKSKARGVIHNLRIFSFLASKCKWKSLFYKRLIEWLREAAAASHWFPAAEREVHLLMVTTQTSL